ncbi:MAG: copper amine oxidase N-terminal domain-containing protein [Bacillota bacterium]
MKSVRTLVALAVILAMAAAFSPPSQAAYQTVSVFVDGVKLEADAYIVDDRTVVPLRAIFTALKASVAWDDATSSVTATKGSKVIKLTVGQREAYINGQQTILGVPPMLIDDRTFIPLRFVSEALGGSVEFVEATMSVVVKGEIQLQAGVTHKGTIKPEGETWYAAESPHYVKGVFRVEGKTNPVLTIEAGAKVYFENGGQLLIGDQFPGGLVARGTADKRILFTADSTNPQAGFWQGIKFRPLTLANNDLNSPKSIIEGATIEYAGGNYNDSAAIRMEGEATLVEVILRDLEMKNSLYVGVSTYHNAKIHPTSDNLNISGTKASSRGGGYAFQVDPSSSHNLPYGQYIDNDLNAIHLTSWSWNKGIAENTTWRNIGIPYVTDMSNLDIGSDMSPTLTIEPGVVVALSANTNFRAGYEKPGSLIADAGSALSRAELDAGLSAWQSWATNPKSAIPNTNKAIVFAPWNAKPSPGAWTGIQILGNSGTENKLNGCVVAYGGKDNTWPAGVKAQSTQSPVALTLSNSLIKNSGFNGLELSGVNTRLNPGSTGNYFEGNKTAIRAMPNAIGSIEKGNNFGDDDMIKVWNGTGNQKVTQTQTWFNHGIPYFVESRVFVGGIEGIRPVTLSIEAGSNLIFAGDMALNIGAVQSEPGVLKAVGTATSPITFSSVGPWRGIYLQQYADKSSLIQYALIENAAQSNVKVNRDLGNVIRNTTLQNAAEYGIYREYRGGTDFTVADLQNVFSGNVKGDQK